MLLYYHYIIVRYRSECEQDVSPAHLLAMVSPLKSYRCDWDPYLEKAVVHKQLDKVGEKFEGVEGNSSNQVETLV